MSKKSIAALSIVTPIPGQRPAPPKNLKPAAAAVWRSTVATKPADWFTPDCWPTLEAYCCAAASRDEIQRLVDALPSPLPLGLAPQYAKLNALLESIERRIGMHARSMRLTQQSRLKAETAATAHKRAAGDGTSSRPWDV